MEQARDLLPLEANDVMGYAQAFPDLRSESFGADVFQRAIFRHILASDHGRHRYFTGSVRQSHREDHRCGEGYLILADQRSQRAKAGAIQTERSHRNLDQRKGNANQ